MKSFMNQLIANYKKISPPTNNLNQNQPISQEKCQKNSDHNGELLSQICIEPQCQEQKNILACCLCCENFHQNHNTKSLKALLRQYSQKLAEDAQNSQKSQIDKELILNELKKQEEQIQDKLLQMRQIINQKFEQVSVSFHKLYESIENQVRSYQQTEKDSQFLLHEVYEAQQNMEQFQNKLLKLLKNSPDLNSTEQQNQVDQKVVMDTIQLVQSECSVMITNIQDTLTKQIDSTCSQLYMKQSLDLFNSSIAFQFQQSNKHAGLTIINQSLVKSTSNTSGYKFAILTPSLELVSGSKVKFGFKMKEVNNSNWIAVGMCHLKTIESKQYAFGFSNLGHGAYMISSNGGSWSNIKAGANNIVKSFKFAKGDSVFCTFEPSTKTITFQKNKTNETYKLDYETTGEPLHPCALFYYHNDEVEFIQPDQCLD